MSERKNPCCVIVGAGHGLGMNVARRFAQGGFDIALISRNQEKLDSLSYTLNFKGFISQGSPLNEENDFMPFAARKKIGRN